MVYFKLSMDPAIHAFPLSEQISPVKMVKQPESSENREIKEIIIKLLVFPTDCKGRLPWTCTATDVFETWRHYRFIVAESSVFLTACLHLGQCETT